LLLRRQIEERRRRVLRQAEFRHVIENVKRCGQLLRAASNERDNPIIKSKATLSNFEPDMRGKLQEPLELPSVVTPKPHLQPDGLAGLGEYLGRICPQRTQRGAAQRSNPVNEVSVSRLSWSCPVSVDG
jgi:hypothetical protein